MANPPPPPCPRGSAARPHTAERTVRTANGRVRVWHGGDGTFMRACVPLVTGRGTAGAAICDLLFIFLILSFLNGPGAEGSDVGGHKHKY